jgi:hypothetical protein
MNRKQLLIGTGVLSCIATLALAHHVPVGLSHVSGTEILREVAFFTEAAHFGVPPYHVGEDEVPGHHDAVGLVHGDAFKVMVESGASEVIRFEASDFADISQAVMEEVVEVINAKATLFEALETNGYLVLEGHTGGPAGLLEVRDASNGPLGKMGMRTGISKGSDRLDLTLSIPDPDLDLAGRPYVVFASTRDGSFTLQGHTIPIGRGQAFGAFARAALGGRAPGGFRGVLDAGSDATLTLTADQLVATFGGDYPDQLYLAFVAFGPANEIAYVSNRFTVDFR